MAGFRWFQVISSSLWVVSAGFRWFFVLVSAVTRLQTELPGGTLNRTSKLNKKTKRCQGSCSTKYLFVGRNDTKDISLVNLLSSIKDDKMDSQSKKLCTCSDIFYGKQNNQSIHSLASMFDFSIERTIQKCEIKNGILSGVEEIELKDIPNY